MGATSAIGGALLSLMPLVAAFAIDAVGWRLAWIVLAVLVWSVVLPIAFRGLIDRPSDVDQQVDGADLDAAGEAVRAAPAAFTRAQALRTPMFGPLAMSIGRDMAGSYVLVLYTLLALPTTIGLLGLFAPAPQPAHREASTEV